MANARGDVTGAAIAPIEQGMIARLVQGVRYVVRGVRPDDFFGPGQPLPPTAQQQAVGRQWDYPVGFNTRLTPRAEESVSFAQMRALADNYDLLRLVIETRKDQVCAEDWTIRPKDPKAERTPLCDEIEAFLQSPDKENDWQTWLRMHLEDVFVTDAAAIYPRKTRGGGLYALELLDGATIKRVIDAQGRTPQPPDPAYQQIIKGLPAVDYTRDELLYMPHNPRTSRLYGYSPVEQVIMTVNIALRRQVHQLQYYTEGSVPDMIMAVPEAWQPNQIKEFQDWFDAMLEGNTAQRRKARAVPAGVKPFMTKGDSIKDEYDEWLARIVCFAFSIAPTPFIKQMNRSTAEQGADAAKEEGKKPLMNRVKARLTQIVQTQFNAPDLVFDWKAEESIDPVDRATVAKLYVDAGVLHPDEVREDLGRDPLTAEQKAYMNPPPPDMGEGDPAVSGKPPKPGVDKLGKKKASGPLTATGRRLQSRAPHSHAY